MNQNPLSAAENSGTAWSRTAPHPDDEEMWREKEKLALASLEEKLPTLKMPLTSDAWLGAGAK